MADRRQSETGPVGRGQRGEARDQQQEHATASGDAQVHQPLGADSGPSIGRRSRSAVGRGAGRRPEPRRARSAMQATAAEISQRTATKHVYADGERVVGMEVRAMRRPPRQRASRDQDLREQARGDEDGQPDEHAAVARPNPQCQP